MARAPLYHWKDSPLGRQALCLMLQYAQQKAGAKLLTSSPGDFGISGDEMLKWLLERLPALEDEHMAKTGQPLTAKKVMGRLYNMFSLLPDGTRVPSNEHPTVNDSLRSVWRQLNTDLEKLQT